MASPRQASPLSHPIIPMGCSLTFPLFWGVALGSHRLWMVPCCAGLIVLLLHAHVSKCCQIKLAVCSSLLMIIRFSTISPRIAGTHYSEQDRVCLPRGEKNELHKLKEIKLLIWSWPHTWPWLCASLSSCSPSDNYIVSKVGAKRVWGHWCPWLCLPRASWGAWPQTG